MSNDRAGFESIAQEIAPGGKLIRVQRLRGGISAHMHALTIEREDGTRTKVTVRRLREHDAAQEPWKIKYEHGVLQIVERAGISAPRPLYLDAAGKHFGAPAIVLTFFPGRNNVAPADTTPWVDKLAASLVAIHAVTPATADLSSLIRLDNRQRIEDIATDRRSDALSVEVVEVLRAACDQIEPLRPTLVHNDYWSGNTIWNRGRITGVIDWTHARLGDPRHDVSECRGAMVFDHDEATADAFLAAYERHAGRALPDVWFFDMIRAVIAYLWHDFWLEGTVDLGIVLDPADVKKRLAAFLRRAIERGRS